MMESHNWMVTSRKNSQTELKEKLKFRLRHQFRFRKKERWIWPYRVYIFSFWKMSYEWRSHII